MIVSGITISVFVFFMFLVALFAGHYIADFIMQGPYKLGKFKRTGWIMPLTMHCFDHVIVNIPIFLLFGYVITGHLYIIPAIGLSLLNAIIHFGIDRIKAHPDLGGRWKFPDKKFFWALGLDQLMHHITLIAIALLFLLLL